MGKRLDARYLFRRRGATGSKTRIEAYRGAGESVSFTGSTETIATVASVSSKGYVT